MKVLKITQTNGTYQLIPEGFIVNLTLSAPALTTVGFWGKITAVKYLDGAAAAAPTVLAPVVAAYVGNNVRYQLGCITDDGIFDQIYTS
jgi:hypothetical protein